MVISKVEEIILRIGCKYTESQAMEKKSFAFKLTEKKPDKGKWVPRDGVAAAGCTDKYGTWDYRYNHDTGYYC